MREPKRKNVVQNKLEVTIEKLVYGGKSLAFHEGKAVFVNNGLPENHIM